MSTPVVLEPRSYRADRADHQTLLVNMPFSMSSRPSLGLGILAASGRAAGFTVETLHATVDFAEIIGVDAYERLANVRHELVGEWLFSAAAFGDDAPDPDGASLIEHLRSCTTPDDEDEDAMDADELLAIRTEVVPSYLDRLVAEVSSAEWDLIGFTSTFQQTTASVALARALRLHGLQTPFVFGGANFDGPMGIELQRNVAEIDLVVQGEADHAFPRLLMHQRGEVGSSSVPGLIWTKEDGTQGVVPSAPVEDLDSVPMPVFDEFFERRRTVQGLTTVPGVSTVPIETARGCWWGAKKHCTFCGLNAETMAFRAKSATRAVEEIVSLAERHEVTEFAVADNIVDRSYVDGVFPEISRRELDYSFFFEVKASLPIRDLRTMRDAGVTAIQPGIESLSSNVLRLMDKGEKAITAVNLLRWAGVYDVFVAWNLLYGFPGETESDYLEQAELCGQLSHLRPPQAMSRIWMERFSPIFTQRSRFPSTFVRPSLGYGFAYPSQLDHEQIAYFFDYEFEDHHDDGMYEPLRKAWQAWRDRWSDETSPSLTLYRGAEHSKLVDQRFDADARVYRLDGCAHEVYLHAFDAPRSIRILREQLSPRFSARQVEGAIDQMVDAQMMMRDGNLVLSLAVPPRER